LPSPFFKFLQVLLPPSLPGAQTCLLGSRLTALTMAFIALFTTSPIFVLLLSFEPRALGLYPPALGLFPQVHGLTSVGFFYARLLFGTCSTRGASSFLFSSILFPASFTFSSSVCCPRYSDFFSSPPPLIARPSRVSSPSSSPPSTSRPVTEPCPFLADMACHYASLCIFLILLPTYSLPLPSTTGECT